MPRRTSLRGSKRIDGTVTEDYKFRPKYTEKVRPLFQSENDAFYLTLWNMNYEHSAQASDQVSAQASAQVSAQVSAQAEAVVKRDENNRRDLLAYCSEPKSRREMQIFCSIKSARYFHNRILQPMLDCGMIKRTIPDKPNSPNQKYVKV